MDEEAATGRVWRGSVRTSGTGRTSLVNRTTTPAQPDRAAVLPEAVSVGPTGAVVRGMSETEPNLS
ncbi:hypothetical protein BFF78_35060 [Streptomyces fodineus]|uniref:Uncharacterized protein n=1 Tax=Streptomyces fodineus TaxID=1904616 RepID=A0A1D7YJ72_9ACTN|nr:hypothetical protein BFF78_35060 [Streptomyces fodineus]